MIAQDNNIFSEEYCQGATSSQLSEQHAKQEKSIDLVPEMEKYGTGKPTRVVIRGNIIGGESS